MTELSNMASIGLRCIFSQPTKNFNPRSAKLFVINGRIIRLFRRV